ncbi:MAG: ATP-dependent DNA helicase [Firmicutes bacterium]|nr:ATP-dependent DNA helicase [Bacillota bacterium]
MAKALPQMVNSPMELSARISVRTLVEFVLRSGDIDLLSSAASFSPRRALEGTRLHQKLQKAHMMDESARYRKEVSLSFESDLGFMKLLVYGRADGIFEEPDSTVCIDEIKSTSLDLHLLQEDLYPLHWAQAKCYGYFYLEEKRAEALNSEEAPDEIHIRLSYIHTQTEKVRTFKRCYGYQELKDSYEALVQAYRPWLLFETNWQKTRNENLSLLAFPFETFREGQRTMSAYVYRTIKEKGRIFLQAPTGIGKTMSALFPALKIIGEGEGGKIFYLTAKNMGQISALQAVKIMEEAGGIRLKTVQISARDKICFLEERVCSAKTCPYARGHYDRVGAATLETLQQEDFLSSEAIASIAKEKMICPFEFSLDLALFADLIIADYNYAFDPQASLKRFFQDGSEDYILLVDEAHNLVDRSRDMFSASLSLRQIRQARKNAPKKSSLYKAAGALIKLFHQARKKAGENRAAGEPFMPQEDGKTDYASIRQMQVIPFPDEDMQDLYMALWQLSEALRDYLENPFAASPAQQSLDLQEEPEAAEPEGAEISEEGDEEAAKETYFGILSCLRILDSRDEGYLSYLSVSGNASKGKDLLFHLFCIDPSRQLLARYERVRSVVLFSATLTPAEYYKRLLGKAEDAAIALPSPFPPENCKVMVAPLPMTYQKRGDSIPSIVRMIRQMTEAKKGKYLVFFPSFAFLEQTADVYETTYSHEGLMVQERQMSTEERNGFIAAFSEEEGPLLGFCVMGGMFAEGIDLVGEQLIGVCVVSVGIPQIGLERDLIRDHLNRTEGLEGRGYEYAYQFPGFSKVLQSAGRLIRSEADRGVILLMDERFTQSRYRRLFPPEWKEPEVVNETTLPGVLDSFWRERQDI